MSSIFNIHYYNSSVNSAHLSILGEIVFYIVWKKKGQMILLKKKINVNGLSKCLGSETAVLDSLKHERCERVTFGELDDI